MNAKRVKGSRGKARCTDRRPEHRSDPGRARHAERRSPEGLPSPLMSGPNVLKSRGQGDPRRRLCGAPKPLVLSTLAYFVKQRVPAVWGNAPTCHSALGGAAGDSPGRGGILGPPAGRAPGPFRVDGKDGRRRDEFRNGLPSNLVEDSSGGQADGGDGKESSHGAGQHLLELHGDD